MGTIAAWLKDVAAETLWMLVSAAPFLLLGLLVAGIFHVLLPASVVARWMGRKGLAGAALAGALGVPLPICSCGVVPVAVELRRKGASRPATLSFLVTTPESSIDSILLTWGMLGPVMAIVRPVAAFVSAMLGAVLAIAFPSRDPRRCDGPRRDEACDHAHHAHHHHDHHDHHDPHPHHDHSPGARDAVGLALLRAHARRLWQRAKSPEPHPADPGPSAEGAALPTLWQGLGKPALRYGFIELLDDLAFWILLGVVTAGVLAATLPDDLARLGLGGGLLPMLIMMAVGIPLYMCASASTPVAAALMAKGLSPGAALVFLLTGPATNVATLILLARNFGRRFVQVYLVAIAAGALLSGLVVDALLAGRISAALSAQGESRAFTGVDWFFFALLAALLAWRLWRGAWRLGWSELSGGFAPIAAWLLGRRSPAVGEGAPRPPFSSRLLRRGLVGLLLLYLASGLRRVPAEAKGYELVFGGLRRADLAPGLHYIPPPPFGRLELARASYPRKSDIGFRTDLELLQRRREIALFGDPNQWHSTVAAMNTDPEVATYLTADENLVEMSFTVHYSLSAPRDFFYGLDLRHDIVGLYAAAAAREVLAARPFEDVLTLERRALETSVLTRLNRELEGLGVGLVADTVRIVDLHPPSEVVGAFRDVASAREDRETRTHRALELAAGELPRARGEAVRLLSAAESAAAARVLEAGGRAEAFEARAGAVAGARRIARDLLRRRAAERALEGREKVILPRGGAGRGITLWQAAPPRGSKLEQSPRTPSSNGGGG